MSNSNLKTTRKLTKSEWLEILKKHDLQNFNKHIPNELSSEIKDEILFAAKHYADYLHSQVKDKNTAEQYISAFIWLYDETEIIVKENDILNLWKTEAYQQYDLFLQNGYNLNYIGNKYKVNPTYIRKISKYRSESFSRSVSFFRKILEVQPNNLKCTYRLARIIQKEYQRQGYRNTKENSNKNVSSYHEARRLYEKFIDIYEKIENKKAVRKEYIKTRYRMSVLLNDECCSHFNIEVCIPYIKTRNSVFLKSPNKYGIKWKLDDIKIANEQLKIVKDLLNLPENPSNELGNIATIVDPVILPIYIYYNQAKIYLSMYLCYCWRPKELYKLYQKDANEYETRKNNYLALAIKNCEYAIWIRDIRNKKGFTDARGISNEIELLAKLYAIDVNGDINRLNELATKYPKNSKVLYFYAMGLFFYNKGEDKEKAINIFNKIKSNYALKQIREGKWDIENKSQKAKTKKDSEQEEMYVGSYGKTEYDEYYDLGGIMEYNPDTGREEFYPDWLGCSETEDDFWEH